MSTMAWLGDDGTSRFAVTYSPTVSDLSFTIEARNGEVRLACHLGMQA